MSWHLSLQYGSKGFKCKLPTASRTGSRNRPNERASFVVGRHRRPPRSREPRSQRRARRRRRRQRPGGPGPGGQQQAGRAGERAAGGSQRSWCFLLRRRSLLVFARSIRELSSKRPSRAGPELVQSWSKAGPNRSTTNFRCSWNLELDCWDDGDYNIDIWGGMESCRTGGVLLNSGRGR